MIYGINLQDQVVEIDTYKEGWENRHYGLSYQRFENSTLPEHEKADGAKKEEKVVNPLHEQYEEVFGKPVPPNKKKDDEWVKAKIDETLNPKQD